MHIKRKPGTPGIQWQQRVWNRREIQLTRPALSKDTHALRTVLN